MTRDTSRDEVMTKRLAILSVALIFLAVLGILVNVNRETNDKLDKAQDAVAAADKRREAADALATRERHQLENQINQLLAQGRRNDANAVKQQQLIDRLRDVIAQSGSDGRDGRDGRDGTNGTSPSASPNPQPSSSSSPTPRPTPSPTPTASCRVRSPLTGECVIR